MTFLPGLCLFLSCALSSGLPEAPLVILTQQSVIECMNNAQCQHFIEKSICSKENLCICPEDHLLSSDGAKCLEKVNEYGSSCEDHIQCSHRLSAGGVCEDRICRCKSGYHYLKGLCWRNSNLHEECVKDEQCFSSYEYIGLRCEREKCVCRKKYYERLNSGCRRESRKGESCNLDRDCIDGTICEKQICSEEEEEGQSPMESSSNATVRTISSRLNCSKGMFELNGQCVLELGMECSNDSECSHLGNAFCLDKRVCACEPNKFVASENNRECLRVARGKSENIMSTSCKKDCQCGVFGEWGFCQNKRCACRNGSYWEKESGLCWPVRKLGESCVSIADCHPKETKANCMENICRCPRGYHPKKDVCVPDAVGVGDSCENDDECLFPNSFCDSSQVCTCKEPYYPENGICMPGVESNCTRQDDCAHLKNTECKMGNSLKKQCLCLEHHSSSKDHKYCLPVKNFQETCTETFQCTALLEDLAECRDNVCQCREKAHYSHGKCYRSKFLGERCSKLPECYPGNDNESLLCLKGYCSCNYDYEPDKNGICVRTSSGTSLRYYPLSLIPAVIFNALRQ